MDEPNNPPRRDWTLVAFLLLLAAGLRVWQVATTEVPARDCIGYAQIAWQLEHGDWRQVIRHAPHHPGYPLTIVAASQLVRHLDPGPLPDVMQHSAQFASSLASVLLVVPMFYLGRALFDRRVGFWATLLFQCLPASGRLLADGLSESLFFLCVATALWLAALAFQRGSAWWFAGVGLCGALALLTRPEGGLVLLATGLVLAVRQFLRQTRQPWGRFILAAASLTLAALVLIGPYVAVTGRLLNTNSAGKTLQFSLKSSTEQSSILNVAQAPAVLAVWWPGESDQPTQRGGWALVTLIEMLWKGSFYVLWLPALLALWYGRDRFRSSASHWVPAVICLGVLPLLYLVALKLGYLSERHTLLVLFYGVYWAAAGLLWLGERLAVAIAKPQAAKTRPNIWAATLVSLVCVAGLYRTIDPMHAQRTGFREAGYWLAKNTPPDANIDDPYTWASFYAGRYFYLEPPVHKQGTDWCVYVVVELSKNPHSRLQPRSNMQYVLEHGRLIQSWPVRRSHEEAKIVLYEVKW